MVQRGGGLPLPAVPRSCPAFGCAPRLSHQEVRRSIGQSAAPCQKQHGTLRGISWCVSSGMLLHSTMQPSLGKVTLSATCPQHGVRLEIAQQVVSPRPLCSGSGTTAAERFFGQKPRSMFATILGSDDIPPAPLSPPRRAVAETEGRRVADAVIEAVKFTAVDYTPLNVGISSLRTDGSSRSIGLSF